MKKLVKCCQDNGQQFGDKLLDYDKSKCEPPKNPVQENSTADANELHQKIFL